MGKATGMQGGGGESTTANWRHAQQLHATLKRCKFQQRAWQKAAGNGMGTAGVELKKD